MVTCPNCRTQLPDWVQKCHSCNFDVSAAARVAPAKTPRQTPNYANKSLVWTLYYIFSVLWIFDGVRVVLATLGIAKQLGAGSAFASWGILGAIFGGINVLIGLGLILKVEFIRGVANFLCGINLIFAILGVVQTIIISPVLGPVGIIAIIGSILVCALYGAQIWVIGETD